MSATTPTPEAPKRGIFGKSKEAPKPVERSSTAYRREKVYVPEARERDTTFSLRKTSEKVLADSLTEFISVLENPTVVAPIPLEPWQTQLLDTFRTSVGAYKPEELTGKVAEFIKSEQGAVMALKVMEWEQLTIQEATKTKITINKRPKVKGIGIRPFQRGFTSGGGGQNTPETYIHEPDEFKTTVEFTDLQAVTVGRLNTQLTYDVGGLSQAQRAYLERTGKTRTFAAGNDAKTERGNIADRLMQMTRARVDFYQQTGFGGIEPNIFKDQSTHLLAERGATPAATAKERLVNQIDVVRSKLEVEATEKVAKAKETEKKEQTKTVVDDIAARLEKGAPPLSEADIKKRDQLDKEIAEATTKKSELEQTIETGKNIPKLQADRATTEAVITTLDPTLLTKLDAINAGTDKFGKPIKGSIEYAEAALVRTQSRVDIAKQEVERLQGLVLATQQQLATRGLSPSVEAMLTDRLTNPATGFDKLLGDAQIEYQTRIKAKDSNERAIAGMKALQQKYEAEYKAVTDARKAENDAIDAYKKVAAKLVGMGIAGTGVDMFGIAGLTIQEADIIPVVAATEATIKTKTADKAELENPQEIERTHKKVCYSELQKLLDGDNVDKIQNRARNHDLNHQELVVDAALYGDYPPVYLRGMQILFGDDILRLDRKDDFQKAAQLLSPTHFIGRIEADLCVAAMMPSPGDIFSPAWRDPGLLAFLDGQMVTDVFNELVADGKDGTLGRISPLQVSSKENIIAAIPADLADPLVFPPADVSALLSTIESKLYHYDDTTDLAFLIEVTAGMGVHYTHGAVTLDTPEKAKAFALEIDRRRKARI